MPPLIARRVARMSRGAVLAVAGIAIFGGAQCADWGSTESTDDTPLVGTEWRLVSLEPGAPPADAAPPDRWPTLRFSRFPGPPRFYVRGNGPCNDFVGRYEATSAGTIEVDSLMSIYAGCPDARGALETAYFGRLAAATTWSARGDSLQLATADARWLLFAPR